MAGVDVGGGAKGGAGGRRRDGATLDDVDSYAMRGAGADARGGAGGCVVGCALALCACDGAWICAREEDDGVSDDVCGSECCDWLCT